MEKKTLCITCKQMKFDEPVDLSFQKLPTWLSKENYVLQFIKSQTSFRVSRQNKNVFKLSIPVSATPGDYVLYWAATENNNNLKTKSAKEAYADFSNHGISKVKKDHTVDVYIQCPQNYHTTDEQGKRYTFYRHVHFVIGKDKHWDTESIYTYAVTCNLTFDYFQKIYKEKTSLIVNALNSDYDISNAIHLNPKKSITNLKKELVMILQNYPKIKNAIEHEKIDWYAIPMIVYCKNKSCHAAENLTLELYKKGFVNVSIFPDGYDTLSRKLEIKK
jgi:hypothetical protein